MPASEYASRHDRAAALKHDLAKYVAWRSANLGDDAWVGPLSDEWVSAIRDDLLATRTRDGQAECASEVWARLGVPLRREASSTELDTIAGAMEIVARAEAALRAEDRAQLSALRGDLRDAQQRIRQACAALVRTTRPG
jgi:hypothetical protein